MATDWRKWIPVSVNRPSTTQQSGKGQQQARRLHTEECLSTTSAWLSGEIAWRNYWTMSLKSGDMGSMVVSKYASVYLHYVAGWSSSLQMVWLSHFKWIIPTHFSTFGRFVFLRRILNDHQSNLSCWEQTSCRQRLSVAQHSRQLWWRGPPPVSSALKQKKGQKSESGCRWSYKMPCSVVLIDLSPSRGYYSQN